MKTVSWGREIKQEKSGRLTDLFLQIQTQFKGINTG